MVHSPRVPVWMVLLSLPPTYAPCNTGEFSLGSEPKQELWDLALEYVSLYVFPHKFLSRFVVISDLSFAPLIMPSS